MFLQARQAYLIGNKALAKELSVKGQLHNMQMKAAHGKAQESIYRQRFVISCCLCLFLPMTSFCLLIIYFLLPCICLPEARHFLRNQMPYYTFIFFLFYIF